jgi:type VI secretion system protein ImpG
VVEIANPFAVMGFSEQESLLPIDQHIIMLTVC